MSGIPDPPYWWDKASGRRPDEGPGGRGRGPDGPGLWLRSQKNRYDVFMRMARVCQADGAAIAARRISEEKHEIVVPRSRRDRTCFLSPFFASVFRIFLRFFFPRLSLAFPPPSSSLHAIKSDLTSIYLRTYPVSAAALLSFSVHPFPFPFSLPCTPR